MQGKSDEEDLLPPHHPAAQDGPSPVQYTGMIGRSLRYIGGGVICADSDLRILWMGGRPFDRDVRNAKGTALKSVLPADCADLIAAEARQALTGLSRRKIDVHTAAADGPRHYEVWLDTDADGTDAAVVAVTAVDMTEREYREGTLRALLMEVAHRSKNLLAIIQSIATQTGRHSDTVDVFLMRFRGRLQSMASSQDLITSTNWRGADLRELVRVQMTRYVPDPVDAVRFVGPDLSLNPNAALHMGLALHELVVNSVCHGGLADPRGKVDIAVRRVDEPPPGTFSFEWRERIPRACPATLVKRFGSTALERVVPAALNGSADLRISAADLRYRLTFPASNIAPGG